MEQQEVKYIDLINLGFEIITLDDDIFFKQYGFQNFSLEMRVAKQFYFSWDCNTRKVRLTRGGQKNVKSQIKVQDLDHLKLLIDFFIKDSGYLKEAEEQIKCSCNLTSIA